MSSTTAAAKTSTCPVDYVLDNQSNAFRHEGELIRSHWHRALGILIGGVQPVNFHLHRRICLSGTLITFTARAVASLKEVEGKETFSGGTVEKRGGERCERSFAV